MLSRVLKEYLTPSVLPVIATQTSADQLVCLGPHATFFPRVFLLHFSSSYIFNWRDVSASNRSRQMVWQELVKLHSVLYIVCPLSCRTIFGANFKNVRQFLWLQMQFFWSCIEFLQIISLACIIACVLLRNGNHQSLELVQLYVCSGLDFAAIYKPNSPIKMAVWFIFLLYSSTK